MSDDFGDLFDDFIIEGIRPGHQVSMVGAMRYRQGANVQDWSAPGAQKFLPRDWHMQCGCEKWTGSAATFGGIEIYFPTPFAYEPIVLATATNTTPLYKPVNVLASIVGPDGVEIYWSCGTSLTRVDINWLALGAIGLK